MLNYLYNLFNPKDPIIDSLISFNRAVPKPERGMAEVDWGIVEREGEKRWAEVMKAQRRCRAQEVGLRVLRFDHIREGRE